jgi:uncharacterized protein (UPF0332 family)
LYEERARYKESAEESERLFSQLKAAWYNWALAKMLYEKHVHCWAVTVAYYSTVHAARTLMDLTPCWNESFVSSHSKILEFFKGEDERYAKSIKRK